jgi:hypothetical protein
MGHPNDEMMQRVNASRKRAVTKEYQGQRNKVVDNDRADKIGGPI